MVREPPRESCCRCCLPLSDVAVLATFPSRLPFRYSCALPSFARRLRVSFFSPSSFFLLPLPRGNRRFRVTRPAFFSPRKIKSR
jgi:hypothetical protein